jgi:lipopolysaccharide transport system permease protein
LKARVSTQTTRRTFRFVAPWAPLASGWRHRRLIGNLVVRELQSRYRGSLLGAAWTVILPLLMLAIYTFVFVGIFHGRDQEIDGHPLDFTLALFAGLIVFTFFSEVFCRSPGLLLENISFIKKVPFPIEVLPWSTVLVALFNAAVAFVVLLVFYSVRIGIPPLSTFLVPVILIPLVMIVLGLSWVFAAVGVFLRDLRLLVGPISNMILFLTPIFYSASVIPERFRQFIYLNPLATPIEEVKIALFLGRVPDPMAWSVSFATGIVVMWLGYWLFARTRHAFADVV